MLQNRSPIVPLVAIAMLPALGLSAVPAAAVEPIDDATFDRLADELDLRNAPWTAIPWHTSLTEARQAASRAKKPVFLVVNTGNCLGFV